MKNSNQALFAKPPWQVEYDLCDGAHITRLTFQGQDLLTTAPAAFRPPLKDYGRYETRPVYGYDDCFPTVDACTAPWDATIALPDHGELCWSDAWAVVEDREGLSFSVNATIWPARFTRRLVFRDSTLEWHYDVANNADAPLPFIHVAHALLPRQHITRIDLPPFGELFDEMHGCVLAPPDAHGVAERLLAVPRGAATMLLLRRVAQGRVTAEFAHGLRLEIGFDPALFPTLGIWWNNGGYPAEAGCRRTECAFEPIAGVLSSLSKSLETGPVMTIRPRTATSWVITWRLS
ncbi:MAG: hypothetical protein A3K18_11130 [Lentisphaerae bacterium RIFOXYA12_64_32]|nr:MAG: hypothetical protein A3K18_11130 [Lentisphaerae bacterium RIFOXYA12_64_32]